MARGILCEHHFFAFTTAAPKVVDAADISARHHAIATRGKVNLLANDRNRARIFDKLRREKRDHVERPPKDMALTAGEKVARFYRVIHNGKADIKTVLFEEHA